MTRRNQSTKFSVREEAEEAARKTANTIYKLVNQRTNLLPVHENNDAADVTVDSSNYHGGYTTNESHATDVAAAPLDRAIERGILKGINEDRDFQLQTGVESHPMASSRVEDVTPSLTIDAGHTEKRKKKKNGILRKKASVITAKEKKSIQAAWMCSFCGAAFVSNEYASNHERHCIRNYVNCRLKSSHSVSKRDDNLDFPITGCIELSAQMKMCMIMTDESLLKSVHVMQRVVLTATERDAERELLLKARDRAYYDLMANLSVECFKEVPRRQKRPKGRLGLLTLIQNKLSDAYTLIKEGDSNEHQHVDQYDSRRRHYGSSDVRHDAETQYINIIVKHSGEFVNDELERLAKQRWVYEKKEYKNHFDRIRSMAHVQALR